jgi:hypothetical protein
MTELNLLYGGDDFLLNKPEEKVNKNDSMRIYQMASQNMYEDQSVQQVPQMQPSQLTQLTQLTQQPQMQAQQAQQAQLMQQPQMLAQQPSQASFDSQFMQQAPVQQQKRRTQEYSFWDRMNMKKSEVIKLALFSLVIVLGISIDRIGTHYISKYISENILTDFQEVLLRLCYPILIFLLLWVLKSA